MNTEIKCFKCGSTTGTIIKHHISYDPEIIVDCCRSCHKKIHYRARKTGKCNVSPDKIDELSTKSSMLRYQKNVVRTYSVSSEAMMPRVRLQEIIRYNTKTGNIVINTHFSAPDRHIKYIGGN